MNSKIEAILAKKGKSPVSEITAYDYPTARLVDEAGIDMILVGDSLGMMMLGFPDTTHVTLDHMLHHTTAVARAAKNAVVVADMPINTSETPEQAVQTARALMATGADAVKLEGGGLRTIIKQLGSAGAADPLDQRGSLGWKATTVTVVLVPSYLVDFCCTSSFNAVDDAEAMPA